VALSVRAQLLWWGIAVAIFLLAISIFVKALPPFLAGLILAYLFNPIVDRMENWGLGRKMATAIVALMILLIGSAIIIVIIPLLSQQLLALISVFPENLEVVRNFLAELLPQYFGSDQALEASLAKALNLLQGYATTIVAGVFNSLNIAVSTVTFIVITPIVMIYLLVDFNNLTRTIDELLPRDHKSLIKGLLQDVDRVMASFIRGQLTVCLILGTFYALALTIVGLQAGLLVGLLAGLLSFIPFFGAITGGILSIGIAIFQFWGEFQYILIVAAIFLGGQAVEGNYLTPKVVGNSTELHPVWILFSLSAFGLLLGFTGILLAVPIAAVIGVFVRFGVKKYKQGGLYLGATKH